MQNNALSRAELSNSEGEIMNVHYGDILVKYGEVLDVKKESLTYLLDATIIKKYQASVLHNGDVIIADAAEDETVGKCSEIAGLTDEIILSGLHTIPCRPKDKYAEGFLGYYMNSNAYHNQLLPLLQGTKVSSISKSAIQDTDILYPKSEVEQKQIGAYFQNLDYLITLHQRNDSKDMNKYSYQSKAYFSYDWEQRKFKDVFDFMQNNALSRAELSNSEGEIMNVHYGDILVKYGEVLDVKKESLTYLLDATIIKKYQASVLHNGDVIIADAAEDETVGKCSEIAGLTDEIILSGLHTIPCRPKDKYAEGFLGYYMNSNAYHNQLLPLLQGTKVSSISKSAIQDTDILYPKSEVEQKQIGAYFQNLDYLITLHQRKFLEVNLQSKGVCKYKKINAWEQRKLSDVYKNIGNAFVGTATPYYVENGHFYLESNNVKDGQINHNTEIFINDEFYEKQKDKWLHTGDMVMVQSGHVGHAAVIPEELDNTAAHALIMFRNSKIQIEPYFLNYQYQTLKVKKKIDNITTGNTIKHILASDMQEFIVDITSYDEQEKIARYFQNLDYLITLHQRKPFYTKKWRKIHVKRDKRDRFIL